MDTIRSKGRSTGRSKRILLFGLTLLLFVMMVPLTAAAAEPAFTFTVSPQSVQTGQQVNVTVTGSNLTDVYGYELKLTFNSELLSYVKTVSALPGFSVPPKDTTGGKIVFAHTKIGKTAGDSGTVQLATITFKAQGTVDADALITLDNVRLVKSDLSSQDVKAAVEAKVQVKKLDETTPTPVVTFKDLNGHWAKATIERAATLGIINGYEDGTFRPKVNVTRAEFTAMIARAFTLKSTSGVTPEFADDDKLPAWAKTAISEAAAAGIITGYADNTFRPNQPITRAEMTAIMVRVLGLTLDSNAKLTFADADQIGAWARPAVAAAVNAGLVKGESNNTFSPQRNTTRAEAAVIIVAGVDYVLEHGVQ